ncbi:hypothetical protein F5Y00DRAFT_234886 [Daldinia vernicosa]|uniref:uncharacterized protein n=1 Tax=Daldinia vernicosa TaxID=114800 RepID=UPI0020072A92|nr:uncharacterized protein F5Y00DRAFT_234886 [Daldinia vernicosa]KAI0849800.1 hypothetical protein F5Y00DRAFT_234886 [Daldinia vernicosa]
MRWTDPSSKHKETALRLAADAEDGDKLGALYALLDFDTRLAGPPDNTFQCALEDGKINVVNAFFKYEKLREQFATSKNVVQAMGRVKKGSLKQKKQEPGRLKKRPTNLESDNDSYQQIVRSLIGCTTTFDEQVVEKIIELDLEEAWEKLPVDMKKHETPKTRGLLHLAVRHQNLGFVEKFLRLYPNSVTFQADLPAAERGSAQRESCYPLWHNNKAIVNSEVKDRNTEDSPDKIKIRNAIVTATIKGVGKMQRLSEIFQDSNEVVNELCFDLSRFNSKVYPISDFVHSLINHRENPGLLSYEHTLKYADFPALDLGPDKETPGNSVRVEHKEVFGILDWLRDKGVYEIIELIVPDRLVNPHNEVEIAKYVKDFKVENLNWRILDMSISVFQDEETKERIEYLHLYSSGKRAVISHWLSNEGVASLKNLKTLDIYVIQELMTRQECYDTLAYIRREFKKAKSAQDIDINITAQPWNPTHERLADLEEIAERAFPKLSRFIRSYCKHTEDYDTGKRPFRPIKVAIIDNGILSIAPGSEVLWGGSKTYQRSDNYSGSSETQYIKQESPDDSKSDGKFSDLKGHRGNQKTLWSRVKGGKSFVDEGSRVGPWLFASDPHGTQMANIICAIDPLCELYVAKVTEGRYGVTPSRVARAIRWAILQKVDIISMSFATLDNNPDLERACNDADAAGIVMLCSTHDEGAKIKDAYPASFPSTISITACDEFGSPLRNSQQKYDYGILGQDVAAGVVPFLESDDRISGSSVATAIAAGLSSLILSCDRIAHPDGTYEVSPRKAIVKHHLRQMLATDDQYILLEKFGRIDLKLKDGLNIVAEEIINNVFKKATYNT